MEIKSSSLPWDQPAVAGGPLAAGLPPLDLQPPLPAACRREQSHAQEWLRAGGILNRTKPASDNQYDWQINLCE